MARSPRGRTWSRTCSWRAAMSSWSRNYGRAARAATSGAVALAATAVCTSADAAQLYYQPIVSLGAGYNTNVNLDPLHKESAVGYFADAAVNLGIATRRSEWTLQP